ncbi:MAG: LysE family translocator [Aliarcobacter sp.]|nr:LysE family translocator [Aliarcobacter sp.]
MEAITLIFVITSILIILTPGQDMILVMSRSISQGQKAGIITAIGICFGLLGHTLLATFGLGALLMTSEFLFDFIKLIGAAYLIYLGYQLLNSKNPKLAMKDLPKTSYKKMFLQGVLSNIMNPKIAIFYFSYLPQFVTSNTNEQTQQLFILGLTYVILTFIIKAPIGFISGLLSFWIKSRPSVLNYINKTSGVIFILLGLKLASEQKL